MCMGKFSCPLCCSDTFESIVSLKYHILSIIENLFCPICNTRFDKVSDLAEHLDEQCYNKTTISLTLEENDELPVELSANQGYQNDNETSQTIYLNQNEVSQITYENENETTQIICDQQASRFLQKSVEDQIPSQEDGTNFQTIKIEEVDIQDSMLAKALLTENIGHSQEQEMEIENEANSGQLEDFAYFCQLCNVSLESIQEHLQTYHAGQEVVVPTECMKEMNMGEIQVVDNDSTALVDDSSTTSFYIINPDNTMCLVEAVENAEPEQEPEETPQDATQPEINENNPSNEDPQTIAEEDCVDKLGRVYTRKVIRIEKFWNKEPEKPTEREPTIEKFIIDDEGKPKKISEEEEAAIEDPDSIITLHICPICNLQYSEIENFYAHNCNLNAAKRYICSECDSEFYGPRALCAHMKLHSKTRNRLANKEQKPESGPFNCKHCKTQFRSFKSLRLHARMHDPVKEREIDPPVTYADSNTREEDRETFLCPLCNKVFDKQYETIHINSHNGKIVNFDCAVCNRKLYTQANLDMHMKAHSNTKKFVCSYCKKPFVTYDALNEHVSQQCQKRQYECQYCGRRFSRPHEKVKHERIHTGEKPHNCEVCGKSFRVSYCLTLHMRTHSGVRPYHCEHCGKRFKSHSVYNHHLLTHSKERNYKCPFCPKAFKTSVQLAGHKNSHLKPFTCTECNRPFASLYAVRSHMETHKRNNNLRFDCQICGASYARTFALRDHIREHHNQDGTFSVPAAEKAPPSAMLNVAVTEEIDSTANSILAVTSGDILMDLDGAENAGAIEAIEPIGE